MHQANPDFVILAVLDGWGLASSGPGNAISLARTPIMNSMWAGFPHTQLGASGEAVGLPRGETGNTETGHLNLGAGRIVYQELARINMAIADGSFFDNPALSGAIDHVKKHASKLHYMGLVGAGGVHSNLEHLFALIRMAHEQGVKELYIHAFTDGRDSPRTASVAYVKQIEEVIAHEQLGAIASVMGRYWAMDRDLRWDRTAKAFYALTRGEGLRAPSAEAAIAQSYSRGATDEFIEPTLIGKSGEPQGLIGDSDAVVFFNFRIDRPRQLSRAFLVTDAVALESEWGFDPYTIKYAKRHTAQPHGTSPMFARDYIPKNLYFVTMTEYEQLLIKNGVHVAFPPQAVSMPLGRIFADNGAQQLRAAESEKERFVTFYFNGLRESPFEGEERLIVPSPAVATYDQKPEMSARELTDAVLNKMQSGQPSFVLVNFANVDMVGHTGNIPAAVKAVETVDECMGKLSKHAIARNGALFITADHGNAEEMLTSGNEVNTEHSTNPVPFIAVAEKFRGHFTLQSGILADVAPTVLGYMGIEAPRDMVGRNLLNDMPT